MFLCKWWLIKHLPFVVYFGFWLSIWMAKLKAEEVPFTASSFRFHIPGCKLVIILIPPVCRSIRAFVPVSLVPGNVYAFVEVPLASRPRLGRASQFHLAWAKITCGLAVVFWSLFGKLYLGNEARGLEPGRADQLWTVSVTLLQPLSDVSMTLQASCVLGSCNFDALPGVCFKPVQFKFGEFRVVTTGVFRGGHWAKAPPLWVARIV